MADDAGDKTEAPTPRRRQEARDQGNIARSADLTASVLMIGMLVLLNQFGLGLIGAMQQLVKSMLSSDSLANLTTSDLRLRFLNAVIIAAGAMAPVLIGVVVLAIVVNIIQVGWIINLKRVQPNIGALNPLKGIGKLFGKSQTLVQFGMNALKLTAVMLVAYSAVYGKAAQIVSVQKLGFLQIFGLGAQIIYSIGLRVGILLLVLAIIDYVYQRFRIEKELKMSKQEVKDEMRRMEGDPHIKGRRRQIAMQIATQRLKKDVPTADVIVTNPTEFAIALKYDSKMHAPRVVAKGQDYMAMKIREIAIANGVPILERKPLARALYKLCEVGHEIPEQFYSAVAEILAYVYELTGKVRRKSA